MDTAVAQVVHVNPQFVVDEFTHIDIEHLAVVRKRHMHIRSLTEERGNQTCGNIRHASGFGVQVLDHVAHALRQIGDLRSDNQDPGIFSC